MKKFLFLLLISIEFSYAQTERLKINKPKEFIVNVTLSAGGKSSGVLYDINDSNLTVQRQTTYKRQVQKRYLPYQPDLIKSVKIQRKNSPLRGILIGAGVGLVSGAIIGLAAGSDPTYPYPNPNDDPYGINAMSVSLSNAFAFTATQKAVLAGSAGMLCGTLVGALLGTFAKKTFIINGRREKYEQMKLSLLEMAYKQQVQSK